MLRVLSPEEELKGRRESFAKLARGTLFDLAQKRFFIAAKKLDKKAWQVIELTDANKKRIVAGEPCEHSRLHLAEMICLNLHAG